MLSKNQLHRLMPDRIRRLPRDHLDRPLPWFTYRGDFRVVAPGKIEQALKFRLCWTCGQSLAHRIAWNLGPMCVVTRTIAEPPSHRSCAMFSARVCPFMTQPRMRRNEKDLPEDRKAPPGIPLWDNPGLVAVWIAHDYQLMPVDGGMLFHIGDPEEVRWMYRGEPAKRDVVMEVLKQRLPILLDIARDEGSSAVEALLQQVARARQYLPPIEKKEKTNDHREPAAKRADQAAQ